MIEYEEFKRLLDIGMEYVVYYQEQQFHISQRRDIGELYFTTDEDNYQIFYSVDDLLTSPLFYGQTFEEVWSQLDVF